MPQSEDIVSRGGIKLETAGLGPVLAKVKDK